ncbi:hypothetical protein FOXG_06280 [Fusarium oxysporum f. sp. lycopersici 4287]|uniref:Zn(2)-C6 fungal-type domain-containing protein n=2 Tax=Fusarium oxysporum TaxID=5507 RepID=A0A0J9UX96_FUSO4|nr:hypothetical protein FOXG_06280 [Fusarium oxysporum f. sp. lycopersici 4287]EXK35459.1 hypothetical protein FOMG_10573 [Fusarium oxysporum f. sp. melonis 26406]KAJ9423473.1 hypothetical protein QL093DRAFT_2269604 [Fusarium oxysporum]KNB03989.1 hypothetical protein FOXG_06280 [Fusarium oxysporum f. sp. lycopersici 4287]
MGRKPNPLILEYFVRGPKLNDNSNRYPHTCKQCGENFPKGRIDSLTTHITKKCPAISESDRMRACLELHGITNARAPVDRPPPEAQPNGQPVDVPNLPQGWSALETLAEASRQVDLNENNRAQSVQAGVVDPADPANTQHAPDRFELHEQFTLDNPPVSYENRSQQGNRGNGPSELDLQGALLTTNVLGAIQQPLPGTELSPEERLQALLPNSVASPDVSNISVAVAATARLNPSLLDPQLVHETATSTTPPSMDIPTPIEASPSAVTAPDSGISQPWGEMTYLATASPVPLLHEHPPTPIQMSRGGVRMDTSDGQLNGRPRHARSRFTAARRKEVQEVRKIGACIRCRILRKNCGKGTPCDTCRKVLAPRVWRTGCVRTRLQEQLDLYSAGVQVVLSQNRINLLKNQLNMTHDGTMIEVSHFPETGKVILLEALVALLEPSESLAESRGSKDSFFQVIMIDQDKEDVPGKVEAYMRDVFQLFIDREPSKFMRVTLSLALQQLQESEDDLLRKSLELWGLVESIDRERQWNVIERPANKNEEPRRIQEAKSENDADIYTTLCMQLNAAAERKANNTSKALLSGMHRVLQDSKVKVNFKMYLTAIIFLNCLEKSTWAFKAWEQDHLRPGWPLERDPGVFTQQGGNLAGLLKMLLAIRKALPQTLRSEAGKLITSEQDPVIGTYFQSIDLDYDTILARQDGSPFSPADSRSLEMILCSHLLITNTP